MSHSTLSHSPLPCSSHTVLFAFLKPTYSFPLQVIITPDIFINYNISIKSQSECQRMNGIPGLSWFQSTEAVKLTDVAYHLQRWPPSIPCLHVCTCLSLTERWSLFPFPLNLSWTYVYFNQQNAVEMTFWTSKPVS